MTNKKKIVVFSGAGLDRESGVLTFRDCVDGLWNNHKIEEVATMDGWKADKEKVLDFYNERRREMPNVLPNGAHDDLVKLEEFFDVTHVTQNVSDLLERAGATNVIHLHGELTKARSTYLSGNPLVDALGVKNKPIDIGYNDINLGDKCENNGSQLRPHIVWFGEYPFGINKAYQAFRDADIVLIIGTSMQISYTEGFFAETKMEAKIFFIDPEPSQILSFKYPEIEITYIAKGAVEGVGEIVKQLTTKIDN
jgi:NAD-dependent deacetylase